jgi:hypothetical protein
MRPRAAHSSRRCEVAATQDETQAAGGRRAVRAPCACTETSSAETVSSATSTSTHLLHHAEDAPAPGARIKIGMDTQHLVDLAADRDDRIERCHRLLKDHRHGCGNCRRRRSLAARSSSPTNLTLPPDGTSEPICNSPITGNDVTDFPDPLSPTDWCGRWDSNPHDVAIEGF